MKVIHSRKLISTPVFNVFHDRIEDSASRPAERFIVNHSGGAAVAPVDHRGRLLLVRQHRWAVRDYVWELPAGRLDPGENPLRAAKRELIEETGYRAKSWTSLGAILASPGYTSEIIHLYLATGLTQGKRRIQEDEDLEPGWFTPRQLDRMAAEGELGDAKTLTAYLLWRRFHRTAHRLP
ncbi:MAG: NUDIX hydrolase [Acidobacteria bacterium]|nr:NUDIX hydrolase [Acidobacteriota bacterium]